MMASGLRGTTAAGLREGSAAQAADRAPTATSSRGANAEAAAETQRQPLKPAGSCWSAHDARRVAKHDDELQGQRRDA